MVLHKPFGLLQPLEAPQSVWTHITMDFVNPLPLPPNFDAPWVAKFFRNQVYRRHGLPQSILSDRDPIFMGQFWSFLFRIFGTKLSLSSTCHPSKLSSTTIKATGTKTWSTQKSPTTLLSTLQQCSRRFYWIKAYTRRISPWTLFHAKIILYHLFSLRYRTPLNFHKKKSVKATSLSPGTQASIKSPTVLPSVT